MTHGHWQLEGSSPELYQRYLVPAITSKWADDLVDRARPRSGEAVIDVACGTGVVARSAAARMGAGRVTGLDLNPGMLAVARTVPSEGATIEWIEGSALDLPFAAASFEVALCQLGLQFFPDRALALREMHRVLKASGRLALSVYSAIERTPGAHAFVLALDEVLGAGASEVKRGEHAFAAQGEVEALLNEAGFAAVEVQAVVQEIAFPSVLDYVRFQLLATPMTALLKGKREEERGTAIAAVAERTARFAGRPRVDDDRFVFPQEAYVAMGRT